MFRIAMTLSKKVIVLLGSCNQPRTTKNPFTGSEREEMIKATMKHIDPKFPEPIVCHINDTLYDDAEWIASIQKAVKDSTGIDTKNNNLEYETGITVGLVGHCKDESSYYLRLFPQWPLVEIPLMKDGISATKIRDIWLDKEWPDDARWDELDKHVPEPVLLRMLGKEAVRKQLSEEKAFMDGYLDKFKVSPYPVIFTATDAVITCKGHVLLVKRKHIPGIGLWALPGGHLDIAKSPLDNTIKEIYEETSIKTSPGTLYNSMKEEKVFAHPSRSLRKRTITIAHYFPLNISSLPQVEGNDDASEAKWFQLAEVMDMQDQLFEDHYSIIKYFINRS